MCQLPTAPFSMKKSPLRSVLGTSLLILPLLAASAQGAVAITDATFSGTFTPGTPESLTGVATLVSVTTNEGTFSNLIGATSTNAAGQRIYQGADLPSDSATLVGLIASDGLLNLTSATTNVQFGTTFTTDTRFFILDATSVGGGFGDTATISLIDAGGAAIGTYTFGLTAANFGTNIANIPSANRESNTAISLETSGTSFSLADFTGTGDFSTATGIRITNASGLDPTVIGIYTVPEPGSLLLAGLSASAWLLRRRRGN